jgi:hypothetical protein
MKDVGWLIATKLGYQDIDIPQSPEFSSRYIVRGTDEAAIRAALHPRATSYLAAHPGWVIEAQGATVAVYKPFTVATPRNVRTYIDEACAAARCL